MSLKQPVLLLALSGLTPITKPCFSTSPGLITNGGQLAQSRHLNTSLYHQSLILMGSQHLSMTLTTLKLKPVTPFLPLISLRWKSNRNLAPCILISVRGNVTESTIIAIIH